MKKRIGVFLCFIMLFWIAGCTGDTDKPSKREKLDNGIYTSYGAMGIESPTGFYHVDSEGFLYFFDYGVKQDAIVCTKPNCKHESWDENTLDEEKCAAYIKTNLGGVTGFVWDEKLYLFQRDDENIEEPGNFLIESELNRGEQKKIAKVPGMVIYSFAVKDGKVYVTGNKAELKKENGVTTQSSMTVSDLYEIELDSGEIRPLLQEQKHYNGSFEILGADSQKLYLIYSWFEKEFDGTNYEETNRQVHYYEYGLKTGEYKETFMNLDGWQVDKISVYGDRIFVVLSPQGQRGTEENLSYAAAEYKDGVFEKIADCQEFPRMFSDCVIYKEKGGEDFQYFWFEDRKPKKLKVKNLDEYYLMDAGGWFYVEQNSDMSYEMVKKEDFFEGKDGVKIH